MNAIAPAFGCTAEGLHFDDALERVLGLAPAWPTVEDVALDACAGRILARDLLARRDLPGFDQSAMDGYAVCAGDLTPGAWLGITGRTAAGEAPGVLHPGGVYRILTGAPLPQRADAVIAQENIELCGDMVLLGQLPPPGTNVRRRGEDISTGQLLMAAGTRLDWRQIAVLAAQGVGTVSVRRRPVVALLSSGRELRGPSETLDPGQIHDSNLPMLTALLHASGAEVRPIPVVADSASAMRAALREASVGADLVLTTAGISVGDEDHVRDALHELGGDLTVLKVAMKPGKPLAAGRLGDAVFIGLPGNPMAALAGAIAFVRPLLARMTGSAMPTRLQAHAGFDLERKPGRTEFIAVRLYQRNGCLWADRVGPDGSGRLAPLLQATGLALLAEDATQIAHGTLLGVLPFNPGCLT
jgi:molybdopterin molybdotransferase